jgi:hypothetical protein
MIVLELKSIIQAAMPFWKLCNDFRVNNQVQRDHSPHGKAQGYQVPFILNGGPIGKSITNEKESRKTIAG